MSKGNLQKHRQRVLQLLLERTYWLRWILYLVFFLSCSELRNKVYCGNTFLKHGNPRDRGGNNRNNIKAS